MEVLCLARRDFLGVEIVIHSNRKEVNEMGSVHEQWR